MKKGILLVLLIALALLTGCHRIVKYDDLNGDNNYELNTITDQDIIAFKLGNLRTMSVQTQNRLTVSEFHGLYQLSKIMKGKYTITVNFKINSGNAKLVICDDKEIVHTFGYNSGEAESYILDADHAYYLRVAGEKANIEIDYYFDK